MVLAYFDVTKNYESWKCENVSKFYVPTCPIVYLQTKSYYIMCVREIGGLY